MLLHILIKDNYIAESSMNSTAPIMNDSAFIEKLTKIHGKKCLNDSDCAFTSYCEIMDPAKDLLFDPANSSLLDPANDLLFDPANSSLSDGKFKIKKVFSFHKVSPNP